MNFKLTRVQLFLMLFLIQTGVVYIAFQQAVILEGGKDSWLMFGVAAIINLLQLLFYEKYYDKFKLGTITSWIYIIYWLVLIICFLSYMQYTLDVWVTQNTPTWITLSAIVLVLFYISLSRQTTTVNLGVLIIPLVFVFIVFILLATPQLQITNILPMGTSSASQWVKGIHFSLVAFLGVESFLILRKHVLKSEKVAGKPIFIFWLILTIFMGASIIGTQMYFSLSAIKLIPEPIFYILKAQKVTFVKRLDIFFIYIWLAWSVVTISLVMFNIRIIYFAKKRKHPIRSLIIFHSIILVISLFLVQIQYIECIRNYAPYLYYPFTILFPILIIFINQRRDSKCKDK